MILSSGCMTTRVEYVKTPLPDILLLDCIPELPSKSMTFGKSVLYNEYLLTVIEKCNADKRALRKLNGR